MDKHSLECLAFGNVDKDQVTQSYDKEIES